MWQGRYIELYKLLQAAFLLFNIVLSPNAGGIIAIVLQIKKISANLGYFKGAINLKIINTFLQIHIS